MWLGRNTQKRKTGGEDHLSLLGKNARFKGTITFEGTARIDGHLEGDIATDGTLIIGEEAVINGNIVAGYVISAGTITGDLIATHKVELKAPAKLAGFVKCPRLSLEEGVSFIGTSEVAYPHGASAEEDTLVEPDRVHQIALGTARRAELTSAHKKLIPLDSSTSVASGQRTDQVAI